MFRLSNIHKSYGKHLVLNGADLSAEAGSIVGILGANGSGKSTLLNILAGLLRPDEGKVEWNGCDLTKEALLRSRIEGYVPQGMPLFPELSGLDNLLLWYRGSRADLKSELDQGIFDILGIRDLLKVQVAKMSGGMQKRLSIACAMGHHPLILLLDEPSAALDLVCKEQICRYLRYHRENGGTVLVATHDPEEIALCDQCYILRRGKLIPFTYDGDIHHLAAELADNS